MARVFSGIKPTGEMQLGNYLGAVRRWVDEQPVPGSPAAERHDAIFCVVDLHAMTVPYDPAELTDTTRRMATWLLAAGLDPDRSLLFVQSHVRAHTELTWILNCVATFGELRRMTQFKEKSDGQESVTVGLFDYPVLMAADILLYDTDEVPVGDDQRQHVELTRDIAIRFNHHFGDTFVVPKATLPAVGARIMDLQDPTKKMSKSDESPQGSILLEEDPKTIAKKIKSAVTDSDTEVRHDRDAKPGISNLIEIYGAATGQSIANVEKEFAGSQYGTFKTAVADAVVEVLRPVQERYARAGSRSRRGRPQARARRRHRGRQGRIGAASRDGCRRAAPPPDALSNTGFGDNRRAIGACSVAKTRLCLAVGAGEGGTHRRGDQVGGPARSVVVRARPRDRLGPRAGVFEELGAELGVTQVGPRAAADIFRITEVAAHGRGDAAERAEPARGLADVVQQGGRGPGVVARHRRGKPFERRDRFGPIRARHLRPHLELGLGQLRPHRSDRGGVGLARAERSEEPAHEVQRCARSRHHSAADEVEQSFEERVEQAADPVGGEHEQEQHEDAVGPDPVPRLEQRVRAGRVRASPSRRAAGSATG